MKSELPSIRSRGRIRAAAAVRPGGDDSAASNPAACTVSKGAESSTSSRIVRARSPNPANDWEQTGRKPGSRFGTRPSAEAGVDATEPAASEPEFGPASPRRRSFDRARRAHRIGIVRAAADLALDPNSSLESGTGRRRRRRHRSESAHTAPRRSHSSSTMNPNSTSFAICAGVRFQPSPFSSVSSNAPSSISAGQISVFLPESLMILWWRQKS